MFASFLVNALLASICVLLHFEVLNFLSVLAPGPGLSRRVSILVGVFGAICAHLAEVWIFGLGYFVLIASGVMGKLEGNTTDSFMDCIYFSLTSYTSLGFGDIAPTGWIRFLAGMEALTGLVLIAWTASFMFLEMQKHWKIK
jgi:hypothetical protein